MVNLNGLLVKLASTDGFHLETGLPDPPLQFPPLLSLPLPLLLLPLFLATQVLKGEKWGLGLRDVQELYSCCAGNLIGT